MAKYVFACTSFITFTRVKIFGCALLKFLENDEWNDSHALVVLFESILFIAHSEDGKVELDENIYILLFLFLYLVKSLLFTK